MHRKLRPISHQTFHSKTFHNKIREFLDRGRLDCKMHRNGNFVLCYGVFRAYYSASNWQYCSVQKRESISNFFFCSKIFTVISLQEGVGWDIFPVLWGNRWETNIDSQKQQMCPELQDWLQFELFTLNITGQGSFRNN